MFESSVNPEGIQTVVSVSNAHNMFESSVNPEGIQTETEGAKNERGLRAV